MSEVVEYLNLLEPLKARDPRLHAALSLIATDVAKALKDLEPLVAASTIAAVGVTTIKDVTDFAHSFTTRNVIFTWSAPQAGVSGYEIRVGGSDFATATFVTRTTGLTIAIDPILIGTFTYRIKAFDASANFSTNDDNIQVTIIAPAAVIITPRIIDNNVLLNWTNSVSTFLIDYYEVFKDGVSIGRVSGTFTSFFEAVSGTYKYKVRPFDIAGNQGLDAEVTVVVNQPPDYVLEDTRNSTFNGTLNQVFLLSAELICNVVSETWEQHFNVNNSFADIQAQITAGFPIYIQPIPTTGVYDEPTIDYGQIFSSVIIATDWQSIQVSGSTTILVEFSYSSDDIMYTSFESGPSILATNIRYLKVRVTFTASSTTSLLRFLNFQIFLSVKNEVDSGEIQALAADSTGTVVTFNKAFKDVDSITVTAESLEPITVIYDFVDAPSPTTFKVLAFDSVGDRIDKLVTWKARGVV